MTLVLNYWAVATIAAVSFIVGAAVASFFLKRAWKKLIDVEYVHKDKVLGGVREIPTTERLRLLMIEQGMAENDWSSINQLIGRCTEKRLGGTRESLQISMHEWENTEIPKTIDTFGIPRIEGL